MTARTWVEWSHRLAFVEIEGGEQRHAERDDGEPMSDRLLLEPSRGGDGALVNRRRFHVSGRFLSAGALSAVIGLLSLAPVPVAGQSPAAAKEAESWTPSRTPWGDPDLQAVWTSNHMSFVPLERPSQLGERMFLADEEAAKRRKEAIRQNRDDPGERRPGNPGAGPAHWMERADGVSRQASLIVDPPNGRIAFTPKGLEEIRKRENARSINTASWEDLNLWDRCITRGLPSVMIPTAYNNAYQILQTPEYVAIRYELISLRIIPLDGRPHIDKNIHQWEGDSRGHWEGNTLVVDVTNFSDKTKGTLRPYDSYDGGGKTLHLVERFTRVDAETINYQATVEDPTRFSRPWTLEMPLRKDDNYQLFEYACHEGNYSMPHRLSAARAEENNAVEEAAKKAQKK